MSASGANEGVTSPHQVKVAMLRLMSDLKAMQADPPSVSRMASWPVEIALRILQCEAVHSFDSPLKYRHFAGV